MYHEKQYQAAYGQSVLAMSLGVIVLMALFVWGLGYAFDQHFVQQDTMLCSSAKVSGNIEMLNRCEQYYVTGNPADIKEAK